MSATVRSVSDTRGDVCECCVSTSTTGDSGKTSSISDRGSKWATNAWAFASHLEAFKDTLRHGQQFPIPQTIAQASRADFNDNSLGGGQHELQIQFASAPGLRGCVHFGRRLRIDSRVHNSIHKTRGEVRDRTRCRFGRNNLRADTSSGASLRQRCHSCADYGSPRTGSSYLQRLFGASMTRAKAGASTAYRLQ